MTGEIGVEAFDANIITSNDPDYEAVLDKMRNPPDHGPLAMLNNMQLVDELERVAEDEAEGITDIPVDDLLREVVRRFHIYNANLVANKEFRDKINELTRDLEQSDKQIGDLRRALVNVTDRFVAIMEANPNAIIPEGIEPYPYAWDMNEEVTSDDE